MFHSTVREFIRQPAGLFDVSEKHFGLSRARRGFVAFCPRNFLWPETTRMAADEETRAFQARHPGARGMAKMLFDGQVALDILAAQPDVDRIKGGQFAREHHELLALAAPRPFLLVGGNSADGVASWPYVSAALEV